MSSNKAALPFLFLLVCFFCTHDLWAQGSKGFEKTSDGVIIYPDSNVSGNTGAVRIQVITDKIIRVTASPAKKIAERKSLITLNHSYSNNWTVNKVGGN